MASSVSFGQNTYAGEVLEDLLTTTAQGNDTFREKLIHIKSGIQNKYVIPSIKLGSIIQDNKPTPTSTEGQGAGTEGGKNQYTIQERYLEPKDFMVYLEFNPRDYEKYWRFAQPEGNLVFRELDPKVQATMLRLLVEKKDAYIGNAIWCSAKGGHEAISSKVSEPAHSTQLGGEDAGGPMKYFDGAIKRLIDNTYTSATEEDKAGGVAIVAGSTELTSGQNVNDALNAMWKKCPKQIRKNSNLTFITGWDVWDLYDQFLSDKEFKYSDNTKINELRFKGKRIVPIVGVPEHTIVLGTFTTGMDSNLWMGVDYANDTEVLKVERLQANSELYFFQMRMKMDVNIVRPSEIVLWTPYKRTA